MAKLASNIKKAVKKTDLIQIAHRKIVGEKRYDSIYDKAHFLTTPMVQARRATKDAQAAAEEAANQPVMPIPDEEALGRSKRKSLARRRSLGRSSTILGGASETLG